MQKLFEINSKGLYRICYILSVLIPFFVLSCNIENVFKAKNEIHVFTIIDSLTTKEISNSIINSNNISESIESHYQNAEIIEKSLPFQEKNWIDFYTLNFPKLAKQGGWDEIENKAKKTITYIKWNVSSSVDTVLYFLFSSDYNCSLWVNKELLLSDKGKPSTPYYQKSRKLLLKKGVNQFVVELVKDKSYSTNCFNFSISSSDNAADEMIHVLNEQYLSSILLKRDDSLYINAEVLRDIVPGYSYSILNKGDTVYSSTTSNFHERIPPGFLQTGSNSYSCILSYGRHAIRQPFIVGSPDEIYNELLADTLFVDSPSLAPYLYRLNKLMGLKDRDYWWPHKVSLMFEKINDPAYRNIGVSLHSFISKIDSSKQHYIAISPEEINPEKKLPVIFMFRPALVYRTHLLTSIHLHRVQSLNYIGSLSNDNGYIVVVSSNRSYYNENISPIGVTDIEETLEDLRSKYNVDSDRIFLYGSCLAAKKALQFAEMQDACYAGIALYNPAFQINERLNFDNLKYLPMYLRHDIYDVHSPVITSEVFLKSAKRNDVCIKSVFDNYFRNTYYYFFIDQDVFSFFNGVVTTTKCKKSRHVNKAKTIKDFFSDGFCIAHGTKNSSLLLKNVADSLAKQWGDYYYAPCRLSADTCNILVNDSVSNLLLIGDGSNNWITDSLLEKAELGWVSDEIEKLKEQTKSADCTYEYLFHHNNRLYLLVGSTGNNSIKYDFRYQPWFNADYRSNISCRQYE